MSADQSSCPRHPNLQQTAYSRKTFPPVALTVILSNAVSASPLMIQTSLKPAFLNHPVIALGESRPTHHRSHYLPNLFLTCSQPRSAASPDPGLSLPYSPHPNQLALLAIATTQNLSRPN